MPGLASMDEMNHAFYEVPEAASSRICFFSATYAVRMRVIAVNFLFPSAAAGWRTKRPALNLLPVSSDLVVMNEDRNLRDEWLALRCQSGDAAAYTTLVSELQGPLLYYALKLTGNYETAKDILQDAWVKASRDIQRLERRAALRSWLYRIVHGLAIDRVRRDVARERAEDATSDGAAEFDETVVTTEVADFVHHALDRLAPKHREVLVLNFLEQFTISEISEIIRCSEGTVKSRLHYAKVALRTLLNEKL